MTKRNSALLAGIMATADEARTLVMPIPATMIEELRAKVAVAKDGAILRIFGNFKTIAAASIFADIQRLNPGPQPWLSPSTRH